MSSDAISQKGIPPVTTVKRDLVDSLPLFYRALAIVLERDGQLIIEEKEG